MKLMSLALCDLLIPHNGDLGPVLRPVPPGTPTE
jgi:hypothetical protein